MHSLPTNVVAKLQSILNAAFRLVTKPRKYEHITPVMIKLHWLPIPNRIQFELLLLIYKPLHGLAPSYLTDILSLRPNKGLRSDNQLPLNIPVSTLRLKFYGDRAFSVAGPTLWNALPKNIQMCATLAAFKTSLKTYLFKNAYKVWLCTLMLYFTSDLFLLFILIFYLYHFIVSAVSVTSHNWMLYFNVVSQMYNSYILYCIVYFICILCTALENIVVRCYINQWIILYIIMSLPKSMELHFTWLQTEIEEEG